MSNLEKSTVVDFLPTTESQAQALRVLLPVQSNLPRREGSHWVGVALFRLGSGEDCE